MEIKERKLSRKMIWFIGIVSTIVMMFTGCFIYRYWEVGSITLKQNLFGLFVTIFFLIFILILFIVYAIRKLDRVCESHYSLGKDLMYMMEFVDKRLFRMEGKIEMISVLSRVMMESMLLGEENE